MNLFRLIIIALALMMYSLYSHGQSSDNSDDVQSVTAAGPFPIYITAQYSHSGKSNPMTPLLSAFAEEDGSKKRKSLHGYQVNLGFIVNEENIKGLTVETGILSLSRFIEGKEHDYLVSEKTAALRVGWYYPFYPITLHVQGGPIFFHLSQAELQSDSNVPITTVRRFNDVLIPGMDFRFRLNILDPAGTSGGLGLFFEYMYHWNFNGREMEPFFDTLEATNNSLNKWNYSVFSFGLKSSLALKIQ